MSSANGVLEARRLLLDRCCAEAAAGNYDGAACLMNAQLYLKSRDSYARLAEEGSVNLDELLKRELRGKLRRFTRVLWREDEYELLRLKYASTSTKVVAKELGRAVYTVNSMAAKLGISKNAEFMSSDASGRMNRLNHWGRLFQFSKGHVPANKGMRRPGYATGRMAETQFKKGVHSGNWMPVGSTRVNADGYLDRKIADTGYPPHDWRGEHILLWQAANGPVPDAHAVVFRDGDRRNVQLSNLEVVSRAELMRRNTIHNLPKPLVEVIMLNGLLKRSINRRERRDAEEQDVRSA